MEKSVELFRKETATIKEGSEKAIAALKERLVTLEDMSEEERAKLRKVQSHLEEITSTVESEQEERMKNTKDLGSIQKNMGVLKRMISEVEADLVTSKESAMKETMVQ